MQSPIHSFIFGSIPPERVGLNGEYDHNGLAKRVELAFQNAFTTEDLRGLKISQRGAIVLLMGTVSSQRLLAQLVDVAMAVNGTVGVEVNGISLFMPTDFYAGDRSHPSYAF